MARKFVDAMMSEDWVGVKDTLKQHPEIMWSKIPRFPVVFWFLERRSVVLLRYMREVFDQYAFDHQLSDSEWRELQLKIFNSDSDPVYTRKAIYDAIHQSVRMFQTMVEVFPLILELLDSQPRGKKSIIGEAIEYEKLEVLDCIFNDLPNGEKLLKRYWEELPRGLQKYFERTRDVRQLNREKYLAFQYALEMEDSSLPALMLKIVGRNAEMLCARITR